LEAKPGWACQAYQQLVEGVNRMPSAFENLNAINFF
jgi:hypothetical protein